MEDINIYNVLYSNHFNEEELAEYKKRLSVYELAKITQGLVRFFVVTLLCYFLPPLLLLVIPLCALMSFRIAWRLYGFIVALILLPFSLLPLVGILVYGFVAAKAKNRLRAEGFDFSADKEYIDEIRAWVIELLPEDGN